MKKLLLLGGSAYLIPVIEEARRLGIYAITADWLPDNIAHSYSDEYHNVSVTDKWAVLNLARHLEIDGIISFAVDPGVVTAAYVAEKLNLHFQGSYKSVSILQNKALFRKFLRKNGFNCPDSYSFSSAYSFLESVGEIFKRCDQLIIKPVDSAGSKGVYLLTPDMKDEEIRDKTLKAFGFSMTSAIVAEQYIAAGKSVYCSECFISDGKPVFLPFSKQHFDTLGDNPFVPMGHTWPADIPEETALKICRELERLCSLMHLCTGIFNAEIRVSLSGIPYIMEFSPRGGGNNLAEALEYATGVSLIKNEIMSAVGLPIDDVLRSNPGGICALAGGGFWDYRGVCKLEVIYSRKECRLVDIPHRYNDKYLISYRYNKDKEDILLPLSCASESGGTRIYLMPLAE